MNVEYPCGFKSPFHSRKPICGPLAVAFAAGVSFDVAKAAVRASTFKLDPHRKRFGGRSTMRQLLDSLRGFGVDYELTAVSGHVTFKTLLEDGEIDHTRHYIIQIPGHFFTLTDGFVIDQCRNEPYHTCKFMRNKVLQFVEIKGKVWANG